MSDSQLAQVTDSDQHRRDNYWGGDREVEPDGGHAEVDGTDAAEYIAFQELLSFVQPICGRTLEKTGEKVELSEPTMYLPKEKETSTGRIIEYRQFRHRRRVNPDAGYINWGESTSTDIPEVTWEVYWQAVHNYLATHGVNITNVEDYLQRAKRFWHDQQLNSHEAMTQVVKHVRETEVGAN